MSSLKKLLPLFLIAVLVVGCGGGTSTGLLPQDQEDYGDTSTTGGASQHRSWTVLVYLDGANNLAPWTYNDINLMEKVCSSPQMAIAVQVKGFEGDDLYSAVYSPNTRRYYIAGDPYDDIIQSTVIEDMGDEVDMASPDTLADFVKWGKETYPADHYMLVIMDHGSGWAGTRAVDEPVNFAICWDDYTGNYMSLDELQQAFDECGNVDVLTLNACLMSMLEVGYAVKDYADIMVASEDLIWSPGIPADLYLLELKKDPFMSPLSLSGVIVDSFEERFTDFPYDVTLSALDLSEMNQLAAATSAFALAMNNNMLTIQTQVRNAQANAQEFDCVDDETSFYRNYKDLYHFASLVNSSVSVSSVKSAAQGVMNQISASVLYEYHSSPGVANAHGISIYIPVSGGMDSDYLMLDFANDTNWDEFLTTF